MLNRSQILQIQKNYDEEIIINIQWGAENQLTLDINDSPIYDNDFGIDEKIDNYPIDTDEIINDGLTRMRKEALKLQKEIKLKTNLEIEIVECKF